MVGQRPVVLFSLVSSTLALRDSNANGNANGNANAVISVIKDQKIANANADATTDQDEMMKNPVRKVVTLLQNLAKKIEKEGEAEKELYEKFVCYCKTASGDLAQSIADSDAKVPELQTSIESSEAEDAQLKQDLKKHQADLADAKAALAAATKIREKEAAEFEAEAGESKGYVKAVGMAITSIEKGMAGQSLLQSTTGAALRRAVASDKIELSDDDRQQITSFLENQADEVTGYVPKGSEVTGILKSMRDDYAKILKQLTDDESEAKETYGELMAAKGKEAKTLETSIEKKTGRAGELAVAIASMKDDLTDTEAALIEDTKLSKTIATDCKTKSKEFEQRVAMRGEELVAVGDTIKILNDDDALELFKKTLPSASAASADFMQTRRSQQATKQHALELLRKADSVEQARQQLNGPSMRFLEIALMGGKVDFSKVIKMIDDMVKILAEEQQDDDQKKVYCAGALDVAEDKLKELSGTESDLETSIEDSKATMEQLKADITATQKGIVELDRSVRDSTEQRKEENEEYTELMSGNTAAKELLEFAKNRLNKFYNPKLYKAPPKKEEEALQQVDYAEVTSDALSFVQVSAVRHRHLARRDDGDDDPAEAPATWDKPAEKKSEESGGVIAMIDLLIRDLDREMTTAEQEEKDAQKQYEGIMRESAEKRAKDTKLVAVKVASQADTEESLVAQDGEHTSTQKELMATKQYEGQLHGECDWLLKYFDLRKQARAEESDNLKKAKATLSGADFSLIQNAKPASQSNLLARAARSTTK